MRQLLSYSSSRVSCLEEEFAKKYGKAEEKVTPSLAHFAFLKQELRNLL
jgi:hypothetical protein